MEKEKVTYGGSRWRSIDDIIDDVDYLKYWAQTLDHTREDFIMTEQMQNIINKIFEDAYNIHIIYGVQGIGKDVLRHAIQEKDEPVLDPKTGTYHTDNKFRAITSIRDKADLTGIVDDFMKENIHFRHTYKMTRDSQKINALKKGLAPYIFDGSAKRIFKITIWKAPDNLSFNDFKKWIQLITEIYNSLLKSASPSFKFVIICHEDHVGHNLERVRDLHIFNKAQIHRLNPINLEDMIEIYKIEDPEFEMFGREALKKIHYLSRGNPREFKHEINKYIDKFYNKIKEGYTVQPEDIDIDSLTELEKTFQLNELYDHMARAESRKKYYLQIEEVIEHASLKDVSFKVDKNISLYADAYFPEYKLIPSKVNYALKPLKQVNDSRKNLITFETLIYLDADGYYRSR